MGFVGCQACANIALVDNKIAVKSFFIGPPRINMMNIYLCHLRKKSNEH
jgi:hypothetical protein